MGADEQDNSNRRSSTELSVDDILGPGFAEKLSGTSSSRAAKAAEPQEAATTAQDSAAGSEQGAADEPFASTTEVVEPPAEAFAPTTEVVEPPAEALASTTEVVEPPAEAFEAATAATSVAAPLPPGMGGPSMSGPIPAPADAPNVAAPVPPTPIDPTESTTNAGGSPWAPPPPPSPLPMLGGAGDGLDPNGLIPPPPGSTGAPLPGTAMTGRISPPRERADPMPSPLGLDSTDPAGGISLPPGATVAAQGATVPESDLISAPPADSLAAASGVMAEASAAPMADDAVDLPESDHVPAPPAAAVAAANAGMGVTPAPPIPDDAVEISVDEHAAAPSGEALAAASSGLEQLPSAPAAEGTPWSEDVQSPLAVDTAGIQRLSTSELEDLALPGKVPSFPRTSVGKAGREIWGWLLALPMLHKATLVTVLFLVVGLLILLTSGGYPYPGWVSGELTVRAGPENEAFPPVAELERNDPVTVLGELGTALMVSDHLGRVGWLPFAGVMREPAPVTAKEPFTRCEQRVTEPDSAACEERANLQGESCNAHCQSGPDSAQCETLCEQRVIDCKHACAALAAPEEGSQPPADAVVDLIAGTKEDAEAPVAEGEPEADAPVEEDASKLAPKKKKKKRRKKRRRR